MQLHRTPLDRFQLRIAHTAEEYDAAFRLTQAGYVFQGIADISRSNEHRIAPQHLLPESLVIVAYEATSLLAPMTVFADSPAGLPLEKEYPEALDALRGAGHTLVEWGALAIVRRCWGAVSPHCSASWGTTCQPASWAQRTA